MANFPDDLDPRIPKAGGIGPSLPIELSPVDGVYGLTKTMREEVTQNLKNLLLTCPGEKCMDYSYDGSTGIGDCLRRFLFNQNVSATYDEIYASIVNQARQWMDYISIDDIIFNEGVDASDSNLLSLAIYFTILPIATTGILEIPLSSGETAGVGSFG